MRNFWGRKYTFLFSLTNEGKVIKDYQRGGTKGGRNQEASGRICSRYKKGTR